jgi:hypothetical protein
MAISCKRQKQSTVISRRRVVIKDALNPVKSRRAQVHRLAIVSLDEVSVIRRVQGTRVMSGSIDPMHLRAFRAVPTPNEAECIRHPMDGEEIDAAEQHSN